MKRHTIILGLAESWLIRIKPGKSESAEAFKSRHYNAFGNGRSRGVFTLVHKDLVALEEIMEFVTTNEITWTKLERTF